jgi:aquaporin Z
VYLVGPLAGALIAVAFAWILRGPGGDPGGLAAARGMLSPADLDAAHTSSDAEPRPPS